MNMIYTNICIQKYVSKPRNDHQFLMTKVAKAMNILNNSTDRSWTTLMLITKICWMIMITEIFYRAMSIITKISPLSCKSFRSSALGQVDHRQVGVLKIMIMISIHDYDDEESGCYISFTWSQLRRGLRWQSHAQGLPCNVNEWSFATLSTVLCFSW